ncbi:hypothetical protein ASA_P4G119 (plasmid) [Aeromonas salmonicida subsp. salmonicida A449]|uniref:Uncharacterized protein n=2 Tax=Aeromonas salmonicida subsp. salmonicida TaxID=29491 RepID=A0A189PGD7_AERSS|nr:hypothetical protein [Aeromonas salmonicida]ABO92419.1 hypothetical protein ASA_P4G119 [Aeromonas salmonicida subsp. salmonicida A449]ALL42237.1 hypothetical protein [Aeromonas salmonicida subsp. salmonicida]
MVYLPLTAIRGKIMIEVTTEYHITNSDLDELPIYKCKGTCKKVWWRGDIEQAPFGVQLNCPMCGGALSSAKEHLDFKITRFQLGEKLMPNSPIRINHSSNLLEEFIPLREKYGWR